MIALLSRGVFWVLSFYIVGHAMIASFRAGDPAMGVAKVIFFPLTYFIYPWTAGLVAVFVVSLVAYWISTASGMASVDY